MNLCIFHAIARLFLKVDGILLDAMVQLKLQYVIYCCICKVMVFILLQKTFVLLSFLKNSMQFLIWWKSTYTPRKSKYPITVENLHVSKNSYRFELISVHKCPFLGLDFYYIFVISKKSRLASKIEKTYGVNSRT